MEFATYNEYYCECGAYLFCSQEIKESTMLQKDNLIFVNHERLPKNNFNMEIERGHDCEAKCSWCKRSLGAIRSTGPFFEIQQVRFKAHLLLKSEVKVMLYRACDKTLDKIIPGRFDIKMEYGEIKSIPRKF